MLYILLYALYALWVNLQIRNNHILTSKDRFSAHYGTASSLFSHLQIHLNNIVIYHIDNHPLSRYIHHNIIPLDTFFSLTLSYVRHRCFLEQIII